MIWLKRRFAYAEFAPYQDRLGDLQMKNASNYKQFIMVSKVAGGPGESDYYVGLPNKIFAPLFDGFEEISEADLPKEINTVLLADQTTEEYKNRFTFKRAE